MLKKKILIPLIVFAVVFGAVISISVVKAESSMKDLIERVVAKIVEEEVRVPIREAMTELLAEDGGMGGLVMGAAGTNKKMEDYDPYVKYNGGLYTELPIHTLSSFTLGADANTLRPSTNGTLYWDPDTETIKLYSTAGWVTLGTTTSGWTKSGDVIYPDDVTRRITGIGTTTQPVNGNNILTLAPTTTTSVVLSIYKDVEALAGNLIQVVNQDVPEETSYFEINSVGQLMIATGTPSALASMTLTASSTAGIPLSIKGKDGQTGNFMTVTDQDGTFEFMIDASGDLGIGTSTLNTSIDLGIGLAAATSSIEMAQPCFVFTSESGLHAYYWPCIGTECEHNGDLAKSTGWATSTEACNE